MAISNRNINFRAPEHTHGKIADLKRKFECSRTWVICKAVDVLWTLLFMPQTLREVFEQLEAFSRNISQHSVMHNPKQLQLVFNEPLPAMFPRFSGVRTPTRPLPDESTSQTRGLEVSAAYTSPAFPASVRLYFAASLPRRAA